LQNEDEFEQLAVSQAKSNRETFAAGAVGDGVRVRYFEAAFLQIFAVIEHGTANE
jgi:hypothetical protein